MFEQERLKVFSSNMVVAVIVNIFVAAILVFSSLYEDIDSSKFHWFSLICLVGCYRLFVHLFVRNEYQSKMRFHFYGVVLAGLAWAVFPYLFHGVFSFKEEMVTIVVFCGMAGGGATLLNADLRSSLTFTTLTVLPYSLLLTFDNESSDKFALGILGLGFWLALLMSSYQCAKFISNGIVNQAKLDDLVNNLEVKVRERTEQIMQLEERDMLTELNNRKSFLTKVGLSLSQSNIRYDDIHAVLYIDLRGFKILNETYGHIFGDYVLSVLGKRFRLIDKSYNSVSGRWGSDEFVLYVESISRLAVKEFLKNLQEELTKEIRQHNIRIIPSYHIGIRMYKTHEDIVISVRKAYQAVQEGKYKNIRICHFNQDIQQKIEREEYLCSEMEKAIKNDNFYMNYQPIVSVGDNIISGYEALVRWTLKGEFISPDEFISIAETYGLIVSLGQIVLRQSIKMLHEINLISPDVTMSINVSVIQFQADDFLKSLDSLIREYEIKPNNIHLEITETVMIENLEKLTNVIIETKKRGVLISIDDFGTGFSSIAVLKSLNVDFIKIDKIYIDHICEDNKDLNIVAAMTKMSHLIGCKVIAEGIEHSAQLECLNPVQVDYYQGYYFSKPVPDDEAIRLLTLVNYVI